jgi:hypothetical protein
MSDEELDPWDDETLRMLAEDLQFLARRDAPEREGVHRVREWHNARKRALQVLNAMLQGKQYDKGLREMPHLIAIARRTSRVVENLSRLHQESDAYNALISAGDILKYSRKLYQGELRSAVEAIYIDNARIEQVFQLAHLISNLESRKASRQWVSEMVSKLFVTVGNNDQAPADVDFASNVFNDIFNALGPPPVASLPDEDSPLNLSPAGAL